MTGTPPILHPPHRLSVMFDNKTSFKLRHKTQMTYVAFFPDAPALTAAFVHIPFLLHLSSRAPSLR